MIIYPSKYFNAYDTIECGQFFRFHKIGVGKYRVFSLDKTALVYTNFENTYIETQDEKYFRDFFDLDFDISKVEEKLCNYHELQEPIKYCKGIRIIKQNLLEVIFSFIISSNNNIPRIKKIIENICCFLGKRVEDYFAFPTLDALSSLSVEDYKNLGAGYRSSYLVNATKFLKNNIDFLQKLNTMAIPCAREELMNISGIGYKVADCILLYGLHHLSVYPVDTIIFKSTKTKQLNTIEKVREYYKNRYGEYGGYAQQYIYHYYRNILSNKKAIENKTNIV